MKRLFLGIYGAILSSIFIVLVASYFILNSINQHRYQMHLQQGLSGTVHLLSLGAERQKDEEQKRWLSLFSSLMDARASINPSSEFPTSQETKIETLIAENTNLETFRIRHKLKKTNDWLILEFNGLTEDIATATAFLLLNELGRYPENERQSAFDELTKFFTYPVLRRSLQNLALDSNQLERLDRGETVVVLNQQLGQRLSISVYAPWGVTTDVLAMGPIQFFEPYPAEIVAPSFMVALLLIAFSVMLIIGHLATRIYRLQDTVDAIAPIDSLVQESGIQDKDVIAQLNLKIQNMTRRIEKSMGEKANMVRAVSHDLRTPIAKIHFQLESLSAVLPESSSPVLRKCRDDLAQLNLLIDELLTYEELSAKQNIKVQDIDINQFVEEQLQGMKALFSGLSTNLESSVPKNFQISGNKILLNRLFENLLANAGRYAKTQIQIQLSESDGRLTLILDDDGPGLDEGKIQALFNPFTRGESSQQHPGYGLGLSIVKQIAVQHHATIEAENNLWNGARFILRIPVKQPRKRRTSDQLPTAGACRA